MSLGDLIVDSGAQGQLIRTEPIQQRSADRLSALLDAAAEVVDEVGFDRITTAMIAERAGASIGTVYRYYPDRVAVLHALRERAISRFRVRVVDEIAAQSPQNWWEAVDCGVSAFIGLYRLEPGFRIIHFVERERVSSSNPKDAQSTTFAQSLADILVEEFGLPGGEDLIFRLEVAVEMADALLSRAFYSDLNGDERFILECRRVLHDYLVEYYGPVVSA